MRTILAGGLSIAPVMMCLAALMIMVLYYKLQQMRKQFSDCIVRKGEILEMGIREPTKVRPYRHCYVICRFANSNDSVEIAYDGGDLDHLQVGDELPLYFYSNGVATVVAYNDENTKKKFKQQAMMILVLFAILCFFIPALGHIAMNRLS